jgi:hypothetical protein
MPLDLRFHFVCSRRFAELDGVGERVRHCSECDLRVHNLDALLPWERVVLVKDAAARQQRLCVSATASVINSADCPAAERLRLEVEPNGDELATAGEVELGDFDLHDADDANGADIPNLDLDIPDLPVRES